MRQASGSRHPYKDEVAILTNIAPSSLGDDGFIQLKGQCYPYKKVGWMEFVLSRNTAEERFFTFSHALECLAHTTFFL